MNYKLKNSQYKIADGSRESLWIDGAGNFFLETNEFGLTSEIGFSYAKRWVARETDHAVSIVEEALNNGNK